MEQTQLRQQLADWAAQIRERDMAKFDAGARAEIDMSLSAGDALMSALDTFRAAAHAGTLGRADLMRIRPLLAEHAFGRFNDWVDGQVQGVTS